MIDGKIIWEYDPNTGTWPGLVAITDIHCGHPGFDENGLTKFLKREMDLPNRRLVLLGDSQEAINAQDKRFTLGNLLLPDEIDRLKQRKIDYRSYLNRILDHQVEQATDVLMPYKDRILFALRGNHEQKIADMNLGTDIHARLCENLEIVDGGIECFKLLSMRTPNSKFIRTLKLYAHHGWTAPRKRGTAINTYTDALAYRHADLSLYGHSHQRDFWDHAIMDLDKNGRFYMKTVYICIAGVWVKSRSEGPYPYYAEKKGYPPVVLNGCVINMKIDKHSPQTTMWEAPSWQVYRSRSWAEQPLVSMN